MRKLLFSASAALLLGLASCSQDEIFDTPVGDGNVNFTVSLAGAEFGTRAFGDGLSAKSLRYAVYDVPANEWSQPTLIHEGSASFGNSMTTTISLDLVKGQDYQIAFFAYSYNSVYSFDAENRTVTIDYASMATTKRAEKDMDCFYAAEKISVASAPVTRQVTLTRPMAQINWGTSDMDNEFVQNAFGSSLRTKFKTTACNTLNILDGSVSNEVEVYPSSATEPIKESYGTFPVEGNYEYLNMSYILVPAGSSIIDCQLEFYRSSTLVGTLPVTNVPVERNYRTNIFGKLLTTQNEFDITKDPIYGGETDKELWDGKPGTLTPDADGNYSISTPSELAALAAIVNGGDDLNGKTVTLRRDINLNNVNWTPIGNATTPFNGKFDGNGYTVSNLYINLDGKPATYAGLFGRTWQVGEFTNVTIKNANIDVTGAIGKSEPVAALIGGGCSKGISNITIEDVTIKGYHYAGAVAGNIYGSITDCHVENADIQIKPQYLSDKNGYDFGDKAGAICGLHNEGNSTLSGNSASNVRISGFRDLGGLFGMLQYDNTYSNNSSDMVTITVVTKNTDKLVDDSTAKNFGPIVGRLGSPVTDGGGNTSSNYTLLEPNTNITTVEQLAAAAEKGGYIEVAAGTTITVPASVTMTKPSIINIPADSKIVVGANSITNASEMTISGEGTIEGSSFLVINQNGAKLTIEDGVFSSTGGKLTAAVQSEGDIVINGGTFKGTAGNAFTANLVNGNSGSVVINGGEFINTTSGSYAVTLRGNGNYTINGGTFIGRFGCLQVESTSQSQGSALITGGTFICTDSFYALAVDAEGSSSGSAVTVEGGKFFSKGAATLFARTNAGSVLNIKGGKFLSLNNYPVAEGFSANAISEKETVSAGDVSVEATYSVEVK